MLSFSMSTCIEVGPCREEERFVQCGSTVFLAVRASRRLARIELHRNWGRGYTSTVIKTPVDDMDVKKR
jgi:hypothetical protein